MKNDLPFLGVARDGRVWWLLDDARRLAAGFVPTTDETGVAGQLHAPDNFARAHERMLAVAFNNHQENGGEITIYQRGQGVFVNASEFLSWLARYILDTDSAMPFPAELARAVADAESAYAKQKPYQSAVTVLDGRFGKELAKLPKPIRKMVAEEIFPFQWDSLSEAQRRSWAAQRDLKSDPARQGEQAFWWQHASNVQKLAEDIRLLELSRTDPSPEHAENKKELARLTQELNALKLKALGVRDLLANKGIVPRKDMATAQTKYVPYAVAFDILGDKYEATIEEIAMWIFCGKNDHGLDAFLNANEMTVPSRFNFDCWDDFDYQSHLMACWFDADEIKAFVPKERYISGDTLVERWKDRSGIKVVAFIRAKIRESRLMGIHPISGATQWNYVDSTSYPAKETAIFSLLEVKEIEAADFGIEETAFADKRSETKPVSLIQLAGAFTMDIDETKNYAWWNERTRSAARYGLVICRASVGKAGKGGSSTWYPDLVAGWLLDKGHLKANTVARVLRKHFPDCLELAEQLATEQ